MGRGQPLRQWAACTLLRRAACTLWICVGVLVTRPRLHCTPFLLCRMMHQLLEGWQWEQERHSEAPQAFRDAARTLLLITRCRGFPIATLTTGGAGGTGGSKRHAHCKIELAAGASSCSSGDGAAAEAGAAAMAPLPQPPRQQQQVLVVQERRVSLEPELVVAILRHAGTDMEPWVRAEVASRRMCGWRCHSALTGIEWLTCVALRFFTLVSGWLLGVLCCVTLVFECQARQCLAGRGEQRCVCVGAGAGCAAHQNRCKAAARAEQGAYAA